MSYCIPCTLLETKKRAAHNENKTLIKVIMIHYIKRAGGGGVQHSKYIFSFIVFFGSLLSNIPS